MGDAGPRYLLVIDHLSSNILSSVRQLRHQAAFRNLSVLLITRKPDKYQKFTERDIPVKILISEFSGSTEIKRLLHPYLGDICGVVCRGDKEIQFLRTVVPAIQGRVLVASKKALGDATNKQRMRDAFFKLSPEITPKYIEVQDAAESTVLAIESAMPYPVIIKPANLASSLMIQACFDRYALQAALKNFFDKIKFIYEREERWIRPQAIVEEYLEGDFYSIDAYIMAPNGLFFCPPVRYFPAKHYGVDDFSLYHRFVPADLRQDQIVSAQETVRKAMSALKLTYSSAHVELVLTKNGWKIIEIGPRLGRFRHKMYQLGYGIDHSLNDVKIHLGIVPEIPDKLKQYCASFSIYPRIEGRLKAIRGIAAVKKLPELKWIHVYAAPGDLCLYAKNGGHALVEFVIASADKSEFDRACRAAKNVRVEVE